MRLDDRAFNGFYLISHAIGGAGNEPHWAAAAMVAILATLNVMAAAILAIPEVYLGLGDLSWLSAIGLFLLLFAFSYRLYLTNERWRRIVSARASRRSADLVIAWSYLLVSLAALAFAA